MEIEIHQASENMKLFFDKLLHVKRYCEESSSKSRFRSEKEIWQEIYELLDEIIKEKK